MNEGLIIIDTSAWIIALRRNCPELIKEKVGRIINEDRGAICGIILVELLRGTRTTKEYKELKEELNSLYYLSLNKKNWFKVAHNAYNLKKIGIIVPLADLIIATIAVINNCELIHADNHFKLISPYIKLKEKDIRRLN